MKLGLSILGWILALGVFDLCFLFAYTKLSEGRVIPGVFIGFWYLMVFIAGLAAVSAATMPMAGIRRERGALALWGGHHVVFSATGIGLLVGLISLPI